MSSLSIGVMNVVFSRRMIEWVISSPSCSRSWIRRAFTSMSVKFSMRSLSCSAAMRTLLADSANRSKNSSERWEILSFIAGLPFGDGAFGCATLISAFHLFGDKAGALRELRRVVRQGPVVMQAFTRENLLPLFSHEYFDHPIHEEVRETDAAPGRPPQRRAGPEGRTGDGAGSHVGP